MLQLVSQPCRGPLCDPELGTVPPARVRPSSGPESSFLFLVPGPSSKWYREETPLRATAEDGTPCLSCEPRKLRAEGPV